MMCAAEAGKRGRRVLLLDHADRAGKKILISGGGRANFTNLGCTHENFLSVNPHFARSALARFTPADMVALVEQHGIAYHEKTLGQLFCDRSARDLVTLLERECAAAGVRTLLETHVISVVRTPGASHKAAGFRVETSAGVMDCESVVVATGGLSIPKLGATGFGFELARQFGLEVVPTRAALVPFTLGPEDKEAWCDLAGVSTETVAASFAAVGRKANPSFREKMLITHRGLSGPAILQISTWWQPGGAVTLDLAPGREVFGALRAAGAPRGSGAALAAVRAVLPARWADRWALRHVPPAAQALSNAALVELEQRMHAWRITPAGTEGYGKAEVTAGGVDTAGLDPRTLEARAVPGLYFIGEVVDVTGWLGGYNFQWAWASGFCAGQAA